MPIVQKIPPEQAARWTDPTSPATPTTAQIRALLAAHAEGDARGLTRIDLPGEHAWRGRVYTRGIEIHKQFSDSHYGGAEGALRAARAWRDHTRKLAGPPAERKAPSVRIVRAEGRRNRGWLAYTPRGRRYFADGKHGGSAGARRAAEGWVATAMELV